VTWAAKWSSDPNVEQERGGLKSPGQLDVALLVPYLATFPAGSSGSPLRNQPCWPKPSALFRKTICRSAGSISSETT
jgi:hypothetical protein